MMMINFLGLLYKDMKKYKYIKLLAKSLLCQTFNFYGM